MYRVKLSTLIIVAASLMTSMSAQAGVRSFFSPKMLGDKVAFCSSDKAVCGKAIADAWCEQKGFSKALLFQRDSRKAIDSKIFVRFADTGKVCDEDAANGQCVSFRQIKCISTQ